MPLNHSLVGVPGEPHERSWTSTDALLYAIGVGAGLGDPLQELQFTTENTAGVQQQVLPTYGVLLAQARMSGDLGDFDRAMLVHAEQSIELHKPLPVHGTLRTSAMVTGIYDKGSGALVETENHAVDAATGEPMVTTRGSTFIRGEGGFGGDRGTGDRWQLPRPRARSQGDAADQARAGAAVPAVRRPQSAARRSRVRGQGRLQPGRSCTACAPTASPAGSCCTSSAAPTRRGSARCPGDSAGPCCPARRW